MNTRPPPSQGPSTMLRRAYAYNLRPVVGVIALISGVFSLVACIGSFRSISDDQQYHVNKLATFAVVLGIIYAVVTVIEAYGFLTALSQRLWMARIYAILSVVSALAVVGAAFVRVIVHFVLKNDLISECTQISTGDIAIHEYGFWGPTYETKLTRQDAENYCNGLWSHDSAVEIISLIVEILLSALFASLSFAYYHQLLDPTSAANLTRRPGPGPAPIPQRDFDDGPGEGYPSHYNPPYLGYDAPPEPHAIPPYDGAKGDDAPYGGAKPPMYSEDDIATFGEYGAGAKAANPFADFDDAGKPQRQASAGERGEFV